MNGNIFHSDSSVSRGFTNGLKVVRNHPITDSEVILHIDDVALTGLNRKSKNEKVMSLIRCLVKIYLQFYIQIRNNYPC